MRVVYLIVNHESGQAYAGLTKLFTRRIAAHRKDKPYLFEGRHDILKTEPMTDAAAKRTEARAIRYLRSIGFQTVNVMKAGSLGAPEERIWTKERCAVESSQYSTRNEFCERSASSYYAARRNGWLDGICRHMTSPIKPPDHWTKENCGTEALKYTTRDQFCRKSKGAYESARVNGWLNDICTHMVQRYLWTKDRCFAEALKYKTRYAFRKGSGSAYEAARRKGWLDEIRMQMERIVT